jgi:predicted solute-binding protein
MLANADAALIIGDAALRIAIAAEARGVKPGPDGEWLTNGAAIGAASLSQLHIYDIVKEWWHLTEKPAVLAVWAARPDLANPSLIKDVSMNDVAADFRASRDFGLTQIPQIAAEAANEMHLPEKELRLYLEKNIDYSLDQENLKGLQRFFQESQSLGLIPSLQPINIAGDLGTTAACSL